MGEWVVDFPRMAWHIPQPKGEEYRKNIDVGTEGIVEGFADKDRRQVLVNIIVSAKGKNLSVIRACNPNNLTRASDWVFLNPKAVAAAAKAAAAAGSQPELATGKKDKRHLYGLFKLLSRRMSRLNQVGPRTSCQMPMT